MTSNTLIWITTVAVFLASANAHVPEILNPLENIVAYKGMDVKFYCEVKYHDENESNRIRWTLSNQEGRITQAINSVRVTPNPKLSVTVEKKSDRTISTLHLYNINREDEGNYECSVEDASSGYFTRMRTGSLTIVEREFPNYDNSPTPEPIEVAKNTEPTNGKVSCNPALKHCSDRATAFIEDVELIAEKFIDNDDDWSDKICAKLTKWWKKSRKVMEKVANDMLSAIKSAFD